MPAASTALLLAAALAAAPEGPAPAPAAPPAADAEVSAWTGMSVTGYPFRGGLVAQPWLTAGADGRTHLPLFGQEGPRLRLDVGASAFVPLERGGPSHGMAAVARAGLVAGPWSLSGGVHLDAATAPVQVLPSLQASWRPAGDWGVTLGLLDRAAGPVARLSLEHRYFGIGYAGMAGLEAWGRLPLGRALSLEVRGFGSRLLSALHAGGSVGLRWQLGEEGR
jgi:hypothetical protein